MYTVKKVATMAGVSVRTLHYYDEIGLLKPASVGSNGYRYYDDESLLRLQQILFFREMGLDLAQAREALDAQAFDLIASLQAHRHALREKMKRLDTLIHTVDATILHLVGEIDMSKKALFEGFDEETQARHEEEVVSAWGETAAQSIALWNSYSDERKKEVMLEGANIYQAIAGNMDKGPQSAEVQALLERWHEHLRNFYEPTIEALAGLGQMYEEHPDFNATFTRIDPDLPGFLKQAIAHYVDVLETRWLERELGILEDS